MAPTWDYQHPYKGKPGKPTKGFPRPLYFPGNPSHKSPSVDGSDCEAYKRIISRLGRWVWTQFDQAYSKQFALGKSGGAVKDSGVAGFQRQMKLDDTGQIGEKTYHALLCAQIPSGLPHAGEYGADARSIELINAAWDRFKGKEPPHDGGSSAAQARIAKAKTYIGVKESPANSNIAPPFTPWYPMQGPWCAVFVTYCDQLGGKPTKSFAKSSRYAYVPYIVSDSQLGINGLSVTSSPQPGDLCCFDWDRDNTFDHVGLVLTAPDSHGNFQTVEGNTSTSDNSNGGEVMQRSRNRNSQGTVFVRVAEP